MLGQESRARSISLEIQLNPLTGNLSGRSHVAYDLPADTRELRLREGIGFVDTKTMYSHMMNDFKWGNMNDPKVYIDENNQRMMINIRNNFNRLAQNLVAEGKMDSAINVLDRNLELIPDAIVPYNYFSHQSVDYYLAAGATDKGLALAGDIFKSYQDEMDYFLGLKSSLTPLVDEEMQRILYFLRDIGMIAAKHDQNDLAKEVTDKFNSYLGIYSGLQQ